MKKINQNARKVMDKLTKDMGEHGHKKFGADGDTYMPVVVERLNNQGEMLVFSVAHYGKQNGDAMRDPEMVFAKCGEDYYPTYFRNDYMGLEQESLWIEDGKFKSVIPKLQTEQATFAGKWMSNINEQQAL